jgi:transcriptional repressor NrdR
VKCPYCGSVDNNVMDSRFRREGNVIRRRRKCNGCKKRFTTYERIEEHAPLVVKKDGRREAFDRNKLLMGIQKACEKRPVSLERMDEAISEIEQQLQELGEREVPAKEIGELVMRKLHDLDKVAYVRFASVYREFKDLGEFMGQLKALLAEKES